MKNKDQTNTENVIREVDYINSNDDKNNDSKINSSNNNEDISLNNNEIVSAATINSIPIDISGCVDGVSYDAGDIVFQSLGRILSISVTIKNVCPDKRVALAVFLTELDTNGVENKRGMKVLTIPAHSSSSCQDITVRCIEFILPEDLDASEGLSTSICNSRQFYIRAMVQYVDFDFDFCNVSE